MYYTDYFIVEIGQFVKQDELIANIETDKVTIPVNCPESVYWKSIYKGGRHCGVGSNLFEIDTDAKEPEIVKAEIKESGAKESKRVKTD